MSKKILITDIIFGALIVAVLFLSTCTNNELTRKIKRANTFEPKIENVQIIDTIYQEDVNLLMAKDSLEMNTLSRQLNAMRKSIPSIRGNQELSQEKRNIFFKTLARTEKELEHIQDRLRRYERLDIGMTSADICGYIVKLEINGHLNESVMSSQFKLLGPSFMFFDEYNE